MDRNSANGVYLNCKKIIRSKLQVGDSISIGRNTLIFEPALDNEKEYELCVKTGSAYLNKGKADLAERTFARAMQLQPKAANAYILCAKALMELDEFDRAKLMIEKAMVLVPKSAEAFYTRGLIQERRGHWAEAKASYQDGIELDSGHDLSKKRLRVLNEKLRLYEKLHSLVITSAREGVSADAHNWARLESSPFRVSFRLTDQIGDVEKVLNTLLRAHQKMGDRFGYFPKAVPVELYSNYLEFQQKVGHKREEFVHRMAGAGGEQIVVQMNLKALKDPPFLFMILAHEYVHFMLHDMTRGNCPFWLTEGLAQFESQNLTSTSMELLKAAFRDDYLLPLEVLEGPFELLEEERVIKLAYAQSYMVTEYLIDSRGYSWMREILGALAEGKSMSKVLKASGKPYDELEKEWAEWLEGRME